MPLILLSAERNHCDLAAERRIAVIFGIMKHNAYRMGMIVILINQHQGPLAIWTMQSVRGHQHVSVSVTHIARGPVKLMFGVFRLRPLLGQKLSGEELRRGLHDLILIIDHEQVIRSPTVGANWMRRRVGQSVVIMSGLSAGGKKSGEGISQPESAKDISRSLASVRVGFGVKQRHPRR